MSPSHTNLEKHGVDNAAAGTIALTALGWILAEPGRAGRLLDLTGLTPEALRARLDDPSMLAAILSFLASHEPDLIACAAAIDEDPARIIRARDRLES